MNRPPSIPTNVPTANGKATGQFISCMIVADSTPVADINAMIANAVATMDESGKRVARFKTGMTMKPLPIPSNPDSNPLTTPAAASARRARPKLIDYHPTQAGRASLQAEDQMP